MHRRSRAPGVPELGVWATNVSLGSDAETAGTTNETVSSFSPGVTMTSLSTGTLCASTPNEAAGVATTRPVAIVRVASPARTAPMAASPRSFVICRTRIVNRLSVPILDSLLLWTLTGAKRPHLE